MYLPYTKQTNKCNKHYLSVEDEVEVEVDDEVEVEVEGEVEVEVEVEVFGGLCAFHVIRRRSQTLQLGL